MQGSIQKRVGKRGVTWTVVIDLPRDPATGKRQQRRISAPSRREAEALLTRTLHELHTGAYVEPTRLAVAEYLRQWVEQIEATVRPSTYVTYRGLIERILIPALGGLSLSKVTPLHIQSFY